MTRVKDGPQTMAYVCYRIICLIGLSLLPLKKPKQMNWKEKYVDICCLPSNTVQSMWKTKPGVKLIDQT